MYMLSRSMYIVLSPPFETRPAPDDTVSVTLSLVCIPRETQDFHKQRRVVMRSN